jgi:hypothetical protein
MRTVAATLAVAAAAWIQSGDYLLHANTLLL